MEAQRPSSRESSASSNREPQRSPPALPATGSGRQWSQRSLMSQGLLSRGVSRRNSQDFVVTDGSIEPSPWWYPSGISILMMMAAGMLFVASTHYHLPMIHQMAVLQTDMPSNPLMLKTNFTCGDLLRIEQEIAKWSETIWQFRSRIISEIPIVDMDDEEEFELEQLHQSSESILAKSTWLTFHVLGHLALLCISHTHQSPLCSLVTLYSQGLLIFLFMKTKSLTQSMANAASVVRKVSKLLGKQVSLSSSDRTLLQFQVFQHKLQTLIDEHESHQLGIGFFVPLIGTLDVDVETLVSITCFGLFELLVLNATRMASSESGMFLDIQSLIWGMEVKQEEEHLELVNKVTSVKDELEKVLRQVNEQLGQMEVFMIAGPRHMASGAASILPPGPSRGVLPAANGIADTASQEGGSGGAAGEDSSMLSPLERTLKNFFRVQPQGAPDSSLPPSSPVGSVSASLPSARSRPGGAAHGRPPVHPPATVSASSELLPSPPSAAPRQPLSNNSQASSTLSIDLSSLPSQPLTSACNSPAPAAADGGRHLDSARGPEALVSPTASQPPPTVIATSVEHAGATGRDAGSNGAAGRRDAGQGVGAGSVRLPGSTPAGGLAGAATWAGRWEQGEEGGASSERRSPAAANLRHRRRSLTQNADRGLADLAVTTAGAAADKGGARGGALGRTGAPTAHGLNGVGAPGQGGARSAVAGAAGARVQNGGTDASARGAGAAKARAHGSMDSRTVNGQHAKLMNGNGPLATAGGRNGGRVDGGTANGGGGPSLVANNSLIGRGSLYAINSNGAGAKGGRGEGRVQWDGEDDEFEDCIEGNDDGQEWMSPSMSDELRDITEFLPKMQRHVSNAGSVFSAVSDLSSPRGRELSNVSISSNMSAGRRSIRSPEMEDFIRFDSIPPRS